MSGLASRHRLLFAGAGLVALFVFVGEARAQQLRGVGLAPDAAAPIGAVRTTAAAALERWDLPGAREALAGVGDSQDPEDLLLRSRTAHYAGEYAEAVRLLGLLPPPVAAREPAAAFARLAAASRAMDDSLAAIESEHFVVRFDPERDWVLADAALEALEAGYAATAGWLGARAAPKVRVEIAPSVDEFERVSGLSRREIETAGAVGVSVFNKIVVLSPRLLARGYPWRDVLNHEYLHYLLVRLSANRAPIWLQEGFARYGEARWRAADPELLDDVERSLVARAVRENALISFAAMEPALVRLPSRGAVRLAFAECALAVEYLVEGWQVAGLRRVFAALAEAPPDRRAPASAAAAREAVRLGGGYPAANAALAAALAALGEHEGAAAALRGALELNPFDPFVWRDLGRALRRLGRAQEAQKASVTALRLLPGNEAFMRSVMQDE